MLPVTTSQARVRGAAAVATSTTYRGGMLRGLAAVLIVAALIAAGGYAAIRAFDLDGSDVARVGGAVPSEQVLQQRRESLAAQYGSAPAVRSGREPSAAKLREIRDSLARQFGSRPAAPAGREPSARQLRQIRDGLARLHGGVR
jgi:hypothetical protein